MPVKLLGPVEQAPKKVRLLGPVKDPIFAGLPGLDDPRNAEPIPDVAATPPPAPAAPTPTPTAPPRESAPYLGDVTPNFDMFQGRPDLREQFIQKYTADSPDAPSRASNIQQEGGYRRTPDGFLIHRMAPPIPTPEENARSSEANVRATLQRAVEGEGKPYGVGDVIADTVRNPWQMVPFVSAIGDPLETVTLLEKATSGTAREQEQALNLLYAKQIQSERPRTLFGGAAEVVQKSVPFMGEFAASGGLSSVAGGASRAGVSAAIKSAGVETVKRLPVFSPRVLAQTVERVAPTYRYAPNDDGLIQAALVDYGDELLPAVLKSSGDITIEVFSESSGAVIGKLGAKIVGAPVIRIAAEKLDEFKAATLGKLLDATGLDLPTFVNRLEGFGYHGVLEEMGEERVGEALRGALEAVAPGYGEPYDLPSARQLVTEAIAFAVPGAANIALNAATAQRVPQQPQTPAERPGSVLNPISIPLPIMPPAQPQAAQPPVEEPAPQPAPEPVAPAPEAPALPPVAEQPLPQPEPVQPLPAPEPANLTERVAATIDSRGFGERGGDVYRQWIAEASEPERQELKQWAQSYDSPWVKRFIGGEIDAYYRGQEPPREEEAPIEAGPQGQPEPGPPVDQGEADAIPENAKPAREVVPEIAELIDGEFDINRANVVLDTYERGMPVGDDEWAPNPNDPDIAKLRDLKEAYVREQEEQRRAKMQSYEWEDIPGATLYADPEAMESQKGKIHVSGATKPLTPEQIADKWRRMKGRPKRQTKTRGVTVTMPKKLPKKAATPQEQIGVLSRFTSKDDTRFATKTIFVTPDRALATDGRALAIVEAETPGGFAQFHDKPADKDVAAAQKRIPALEKALAELGEKRPSLTQPYTVRADWDRKWDKATEELDRLNGIISQSIGTKYDSFGTKAKPGIKKGAQEGSFPPHWESVVPKYSDSDYVNIDTLETIQYVRKADLLTGEDHPGVVVVRNPDNSIGFASYSASVGQAEINVQDGNVVLGAADPGYLIDALELAARSGDSVARFAMPRPDKPLVIQAGRFKTVVMPMRSEGAGKAYKSPLEEEAEEEAEDAVADEAPTGGGSTHATVRGGAEVPSYETRAGEAVGVARERIEALELPELVKLTRQILNDFPSVRKMAATRLGEFVATGPGSININPQIANDPKQLARTLAHEIGHAMDYLPQRTMKRGNLLGRLLSRIRHFKHTFVPPGFEKLSKEEKDALMKRAEDELSEHIEEEVDLFVEVAEGITARDVLAVWNSLDTSHLPAGMKRAIASMSRAQKVAVLKQATKGVVPEELQAYASYVRHPTGVKFMIVGERKADPAKVKERYEKLLYEEMTRRGMLDVAIIRKELMDLSAWWRPWNRQTASGNFRRYRDSGAELYADAISVLLNAPGELQERAPHFYRAFFDHLDKKPKAMRAYLDLQDTIQGVPEELQAARRADMREGFQRGEEVWRARQEELREMRRSVVKLFKQLFFDKGAPVLDAEAAAVKRGAVIPESESPRFALDELAYKDGANHVFLSDVQRNVWEPLEQAGVTMEDAGEYMALRRMVNERAELANPYGHTADTAEEAMKDLKRVMGAEKFAELERRMQRFDDRVFETAEEAVEVGVYNKSTFDTAVVPNKGNYAAFAVVDYLEANMPAGIRKQVGTFREIANPFVATIAKTVSLKRAIELNRAKNVVRDFYRKQYPKSIKRRVTAPGRQPGKPKPGHAHMVVLENGRAVFYEVDKYVAKVFEHNDIGLLSQLAKVITKATYTPFHALYVTASPGFATFNLFRDIKRTYKNLAAVKEHHDKPPTLGETLKAYWQAKGAAWRRARKQFDPLIDEMMDQKVLDIPFVSYEWTQQDLKHDRLMKKYGLGQSKKSRSRFVNMLGAIFHGVESVSVFSETLPKVATYNMLGARGVEGRYRNYVVRNYVGTPNYKTKGLATELTNGLMMYSNVVVQGLRADAHVATQPSTAAGYWVRASLMDFLPKIAMKGAEIGLFGATVAALMKMIPDSDKKKYIVIPLGAIEDDKSGEMKVLYLRFPHDDVNRILAAMAWDAMQAKFTGVAESVFGEVPGISPPLEMAHNWAQFIQGKNPRDAFRGRDVVPRDEWAAGGWYSTEAMIRWTMDQFGVASTIAHGFIGKPGNPAQETYAEKIIGSLPGIERIVRMSNRGMQEDAWAEVREEEGESARRRLKLDKVTRRMVRDRYRLSRLGEERLSQTDNTKRLLLNEHYKIYLVVTQGIKAAEERKDQKEADRLRKVLEDTSEKFDKSINQALKRMNGKAG
jgi:hypothetical protein